MNSLLVVYLHGFRSSPRSSKAQMTGDAIAHRVKQGAAIEWYCPQLPPSPQAALTMVKQKIAETKAKDLCIITSNNIIGTPVTFNEDNCNYGEEVINVSASDGNYFPSAVPFHIGAYSGTIKNKRYSTFR